MSVDAEQRRPPRSAPNTEERVIMPLVEVSFPGGKQVDAAILGRHIPTDQDPESGGEGRAPEPFQLFLASIATCAGIYAKSFCDERGLPAPRGLVMDIARDEAGLISRLELVLRVNGDFPEKYDRAVARSMGLCAVKKQLRGEIETEIRVERQG
jgi:ribosomal protein S12 methylthiotransferase accessory factor